jgi:transcriptional regulator GlxA family with amidase domain
VAEIVITVSLPSSAGDHTLDNVTDRRILFAVVPDFQVLDLAGPYEVYAQLQRRIGGQSLQVVGIGDGPLVSSGGLAVQPTATIDACDDEPVDTLIAVGGDGVFGACEDERFVDWFTRTSQRARRTASVCSGAFVLARAGLLDGHRAVTHWAHCERLAQQYPGITVDPDPIFVREGEVWTSAGVTAGIDLALAMVEDDHGPDMARAIARQLVMFVQRPGGQAQFSAQMTAQRPARASLRDIQAWLTDHLDGDLTVPTLAARAGMSERNFTRVFRAETGQTPAAYVEAARIEAARRLLETTDASIGAVARACGFGTVETLHRSFRRILRATPNEYRIRFSAHHTG